MKRPLGILVTMLVLGGLAAGGMQYWKTRQAPSDKPAATAPAGKAQMPPGGMPVVTETVTPRDITTPINAVGSLIASEAADIHTEIAGQIEKILFEEGQPVKKGDVLIQIDRSLVQTELSKAQATYEATAATFRRDDKLKESGYVSNQKWDLSRSDLQTAKSAVENARIRLEKTAVRAPFDGVAGLRSFSVGDYAQVGQVLTTIDTLDPLKLEFSVPERYFTNIQIGQKITFGVDAWPGQTFEGSIYAIDPRINPDTHNFSVKANIPNADSRLRPGMYARIAIATATRTGVIMVPEEALIPQGNDSFVYVIEDGKAAMKQVTRGIRDNNRVEITEGLEAGAEVITAGTMRIGPGMPVQSLPATAPAAMTESTPAAGTTKE